MDSQLGLDALEWGNGEGTFSDAGAEAGDNIGRARDLAVLVGEQALVLIEGDEADSGLERVTDDEGGAAGVPLRAEGWPWKLLPRGQAPVELRAGFGELCGVGDGNFNGAGRAACDNGAQGAGLGGGLGVESSAVVQWIFCIM